MLCHIFAEIIAQQLFFILTVMMIPCCDFYVPKIIPAKAPLLQNIKECFSSLIRIQNIVKAAAVIPTIQYKTNTLSTPY